MDFVLRIFFSGLILFSPSKDGKELTVLLVNTPHATKLADGTLLPHHMPLLVARARSCEPECAARDAAIAQFLFAGKGVDAASDALQAAVLGGGAWQLSGSDLSLRGAEAPLNIVTNSRGRKADGSLEAIPTTAAEREDFSWVPKMSDVLGGSVAVRPELLSDHPPAALIAARLRLHSGRVFTYSVIRVDGKVRPIHFRTSETAPDASFAQALAGWAEAEIHIPGDVVEVVDQNLNTGAKRSMKLHPQEGVVEMAILNLPPFKEPSPDAAAPLPKPGQHFEAYYSLLAALPAPAKRVVPHLPRTLAASDPQVDWVALHPRDALWSDLLEKLGLSPRSRAPYDLVLCPMSQVP